MTSFLISVYFDIITHGTSILPDKLMLDLLNESQWHQLDP